MNDSLETLLNSQCVPLNKNDSPLNLSDIERLRNLTPNWQYCATENVLCRTFRFNDYRTTIEFVNQVATIAETQDHHPDMHVAYNRCKVSFSTHSVGGVTRNDFICAANLDALS